jgi:hypothetical protein
MDKEAEELKQVRMVVAAVVMHAMLTNKATAYSEIDGAHIAQSAFTVADAMLAWAEQTS